MSIRPMHTVPDSLQRPPSFLGLRHVLRHVPNYLLKFAKSSGLSHVSRDKCRALPSACGSVVGSQMFPWVVRPLHINSCIANGLPRGCHRQRMEASLPQRRVSGWPPTRQEARTSTDTRLGFRGRIRTIAPKTDGRRNP
jgi:hypothetical protein